MLKTVTMHKSEGMVTSTGLLLFDGKKQANISLETPDIFTTPKKPKSANRMKAYVLAYHLALMITQGKSNAAYIMACDWLKLADASSIRRAMREYKIPKNSYIMVSASPLGVMVILEPKKIITFGNNVSYHGKVWAWKEGDHKAFVGEHSFVNVDDLLLIESPLKLLSHKKSI